MPAEDRASRNDRELEVKFETDAAGLERAGSSSVLAAAKAHRNRSTLHTVYYDTAQGDLWKQRTMLRVRKSGRGYVMTVKWPTSDGEGIFSRGEIEITSSGPQPDIGQFDEATAARLREHIGDKPLEARFATDFKRRVFDLEHGQAHIEIALDEGFIVAGERRAPLQEIELELKSGDASALYDAALRLAQEAPLRLGMLSKGERGVMLADGIWPSSRKADDPVLAPEATLDEAVTAIIGTSLDHFVRNMPALDHEDAVEAVHQLRVAMRRLRTALAIFDRELPCPEFDEFRAAAKSLASALGPARDWDIFGERVAALPTAAHGNGGLGNSGSGDKGFVAFLAAIETRRREAYAAARETIAAPPTTRFVLTLQSLLVRRPWRNRLSADDLPRLTTSARDFAARDIERLHDRVLRRGKNLLDAPPEQRHKVRIALKNLRYALEFFGSLFDKDQVRAQVKAVSRLQTVLGDYNDAVTAMGLARAAEETAGAQAARAGGIVEGWFAHATTAGDDETLRKLWKRFREAGHLSAA